MPVPLKLGEIELDVPFFQASLSGYSDRAMRRLAREFGAPFALTGVILAKSAAHPGVLRKPTYSPALDPHPVGAQLLGEEPHVMVRAAQCVVAAGYDLVDLNFACPVPKVLRRDRGGAILRDPDRALAIYRAVRDAVRVPVTVKLRIGFDHSEVHRDCFLEIYERLAGEGVDAVTVHARTVNEQYRGRADWSVLADLARRFPKVVLVGSGDVYEAADVTDRIADSGVSGVAVARGAVGNPWIFRDARALCEGRPLPPPPTPAEVGEVMLRHLELVLGLYTESKAIKYFRKFCPGYCRRHPRRRQAMIPLVTTKSANELVRLIREWFGL